MTILSSCPESVGASVPGGSTRWQVALKEAVRDPVQLCRLLRLPLEVEAAAARGARQFPVFVPRDYIARMRCGDPNDPLLRQVLPLDGEVDETEGFSIDPVADAAATLRPGMIQKYHGRVLLVTTGACAVHCRYCFRRHFPYSDAPRSLADWQPALANIASDDTITEVILSGGDPLMLVDEHLEGLVGCLAEIRQVRRARIHTRLPIMIPDRVNDDLLRWLRGTRLATIVVVHVNHPSELDQAVCHALGRMVNAGVPVLNQAVLLRGVNDDVDTLEQLCLRLVDERVIPYYLHQLDRVQGASHFEVPVERGRKLLDSLRARVPGYAVPRFVREVPGSPSKHVLA